LQKTIGFLQTYDPFEPSLFITNHVAKGGLVVWLANTLKKKKMFFDTTGLTHEAKKKKVIKGHFLGL
jgi:hypothetical protein